MATGPEHYREAERLLAGRTFPSDPELHIEERHVPPTTDDLLAGIGHALLANAAASALNDHSHDEGGMPLQDYDAWVKAASGWQPKRKAGED